jgi:hypothetical protein
MASFFRPNGEARYRILYYDENGERRQETGYTDKQKTEKWANELEDRARHHHEGETDSRSSRTLACELSF